jgi:hypothetical protein
LSAAEPGFAATRFADVKGFRRRTPVRLLIAFALLVPLGLAACGGREDRTVVVNPPATVVAPPATSSTTTTTRTCLPGTIC